jgi:selenide,water dikinase
VPVIPAAITYLEKNSIPGGTIRNWKSYGHKIGALTDHQKHILADPQTSGGLLASIDPHHAGAFEKEMESLQVKVYPIGRLKQYIVNQPLITIND